MRLRIWDSFALDRLGQAPGAASGLLGLVHGSVGRVDDQVDAARGVGDARHADAQADDHHVAADAGHQVGGADQGRQPLGDDGQHGVAGGMAMGVVDHLETVEIKVEDGRQSGTRRGERRAEGGEEAGSVGQSGQPIVSGGPLELHLLVTLQDGQRQQAQNADERHPLAEFG